jgi:hypothetical protein
MLSKEIELETPFDGFVPTGTFVDIEFDEKGNLLKVSLPLEDAIKLVKVVKSQTREIPCD